MLLTPGDPRYPALLGVIASPPSVHVRGAIVAADGLAIAIVGSRRASTYGLEVAERLAFDLAARGVTIVSGLARASMPRPIGARWWPTDVRSRCSAAGSTSS